MLVNWAPQTTQWQVWPLSTQQQHRWRVASVLLPTNPETISKSSNKVKERIYWTSLRDHITKSKRTNQPTKQPSKQKQQEQQQQQQQQTTTKCTWSPKDRLATRWACWFCSWAQSVTSPASPLRTGPSTRRYSKTENYGATMACGRRVTRWANFPTRCVPPSHSCMGTQVCRRGLLHNGDGYGGDKYDDNDEYDVLVMMITVVVIVVVVVVVVAVVAVVVVAAVVIGLWRHPSSYHLNCCGGNFLCRVAINKIPY